jgi:hypothetical protein
MDPDYETEMTSPLSESLTKMEKIRERRRSIDGIITKAREDQLRAKFFCFECPLMNACREAGWQEGHHVWGGLDANERFRALQAGTIDSVVQMPKSGIFSLAHPVVRRFLEGESAAEIAEDLGKAVSTVMNQLRGALATLRAQREDEERWRSRKGLPALPPGMTHEGYRHGLAVWSLSRERSA